MNTITFNTIRLIITLIGVYLMATVWYLTSHWIHLVITIALIVLSCLWLYFIIIDYANKSRRKKINKDIEADKVFSELWDELHLKQ